MVSSSSLVFSRELLEAPENALQAGMQDYASICKLSSPNLVEVEDSILELVGSISSSANSTGFCLSYADFKERPAGNWDVEAHFQTRGSE